MNIISKVFFQTFRLVTRTLRRLVMHRPGKTANTLNKINVHDLHEYSTFFLIGLVKPEFTFEMRLFSGFDSHTMLSRFDGNRFIFPNHKLY